MTARRAARRPRDERGATIVVVALSMTALIAFAGLVLDGGRNFAIRRQAQNAADAAALAGAQALYAAQAAGASVSVADVVTAKLASNTANLDPACEFVQADGSKYSPSAPCSAAIPATAAGVVVQAGRQEATTFAKAVGYRTILSRATATAFVQPLAAVKSPFIVCGNPAIGGRNILNLDGSVNSTAATAMGAFDLEGPQVPDCNDPSSKFKGKADPSYTGSVSVGTYEPADQGNGYNGVIATQVAGLTPCPADITALRTSCGMVIPIADGPGGTASRPTLRIAAFAIFNVTPGDGGGNPRYRATFVRPTTTAVDDAGLAGQLCSYGSQVCVIRLGS